MRGIRKTSWKAFGQKINSNCEVSEMNGNIKQIIMRVGFLPRFQTC